MSACQIASPSPSPPIGTPSCLMLEITFISGWSARNGRPSGFGPGGSSSPKLRLKARISGSASFWPRNRITRCSSHAARMSENTAGGIGRERSMPPISAPSASPISRTSSKLDDHRLVVRGLRVRVDADRFQARRELGRDEDIVATIRRFAVVQVKRRLARLAGIQRVPRVDEARVEHLAMMRILGLEVEVAAHDRALASLMGFIASGFLHARVLGTRLDVQLGQTPDLRLPVPARVVLEMRRHHAQPAVYHHFDDGAR